MKIDLNDENSLPAPYVWEDHLNAAWAKLTPNEKGIALAYKQQLLTDKRPTALMVNFISDLYNKYEDFSTAVIP